MQEILFVQGADRRGKQCGNHRKKRLKIDSEYHVDRHYCFVAGGHNCTAQAHCSKEPRKNQQPEFFTARSARWSGRGKEQKYHKRKSDDFQIERVLERSEEKSAIAGDERQPVCPVGETFFRQTLIEIGRIVTVE